MYKFIFFVPELFVEKVKLAIFAAGAGQIGEYNHCSWQVLGEGQFKALEGANPFLGKVGQVEKVLEYRVEVLCEAKYASAVVKALKDSHPYETPAYEFVKVEEVL